MGMTPGMIGTSIPASLKINTVYVNEQKCCTFRANFRDPLEVIIHVVEQLSDDEFCACVDLLLQMLELAVFVRLPVGVPIGIRCTNSVVSMSTGVTNVME